MTIKKRLARSNLLMILLPVCITGAMAAGCLGLVWYGVVHGGGQRGLSPGQWRRGGAGG